MPQVRENATAPINLTPCTPRVLRTRLFAPVRKITPPDGGRRVLDSLVREASTSLSEGAQPSTVCVCHQMMRWSSRRRIVQGNSSGREQDYGCRPGDNRPQL